MQYIKQMVFLVLAFSFFSYSQEPSPKNISQYTSELLALLDHESTLKRLWAADQLSLLGEHAQNQMIARYASASYRTRREIVHILAKNPTKEIKEYLLQCLFDKDYGVRNRVSLCLLSLCDKDKDIWEKIKSLSHKNKEIQKSIDILKKTIIYKKVEKHLCDLISPQGGFGFYEGQFQNMLYLQKDAIDPLLDIFMDKEYAFVHIEYQGKDWNAYTIRYLAGEALPQFETWMEEKKGRVLLQLRSMIIQSYEQKEEQIRDIAMTALYFLGDKSYLEERIRDYQINIETYETLIGKRKFFLEEYQQKLAENYSELGMIYLRIRQEKKGIEMLQKATHLDPKNGLVYYNLACAYSCLNKIQESLDALEKAVAKGYNDVQWMLKDGDLRNIHNTKRFQEIIKKLQDKPAGN